MAQVLQDIKQKYLKSHSHLLCTETMAGDDVENAPPRTHLKEIPPTISPILDGFLYLGNCKSPRLATAYNIKHVIVLLAADEYVNNGTAMRYSPPVTSEIVFRIEDGDYEEGRMLEILPVLLSLLDTNHTRGEATLVHCYAGLSRSATVVVAWIAHHFHWDWRAALLHVQERRPRVMPNPGFMRALRTYFTATPAIIVPEAAEDIIID